jgi:hypothetical protein
MIIGVKATGKEGAEFGMRYISKLRFLEKNNCRISRQKFSKDVSAFNAITQASYIPTGDQKGPIHRVSAVTPLTLACSSSVAPHAAAISTRVLSSLEGEVGSDRSLERARAAQRRREAPE